MNRLVLKSIESFAGKGGEMEAETILKHRASLKSHTSRGNVLTKVCAVAILVLASALGGYAQKLTGNLSPLKGQKEVNVVIDMKGVTVNRNPEDKYIAEQTKNKPEADVAKWMTEWNTDLRRNAYEKVVQGINDEVGKKSLFTAGDYPQAEYTIHFKIINIETGYFAGVTSRPATLNAEVTFVKKGESAPFANVAVPRAMHRMGGTIPYFVTRIAMSFGALGQVTGQVITKNVK